MEAAAWQARNQAAHQAQVFGARLLTGVLARGGVGKLQFVDALRHVLLPHVLQPAVTAR